MNKLVAILALGVCFSNVYAKGPKKNKAEEEGYVFTTVKELRRYSSLLRKIWYGSSGSYAGYHVRRFTS